MSRICLLSSAVVLLSACGPSQIGFASDPVSVPVDDCSGAVVVQLQGGDGKAAKATADTSIALTSGGLVSFHSDSSCSTSITSVTVAKDAESATVYVKGLIAGQGTLTANVDKLKPGTQAVTVTIPVYSVADLCNDLPNALCNYYLRCGRVQSQAECIDLVNNRQHTLDGCGRDQSAAVKDGRLTADPVNERRCVAGIKNTAMCSRDDVRTLVPECGTAFTGTVATSMSCYVDEECGNAGYCTGTGSSCPGQCQPRLAASASATRDRQCVEGLYVYNGTCVAPVSANGACGFQLPSLSKQRCVSGFFCDNNNVCSMLKPSGQTCSNESDCANVLVCSNGTCAEPGSAGATCNIGILGQPNIPCKADLYCDVTALGTPGVCKVLEPAGGRCFTTAGCKPGTFCRGAQLIGTPTKGTCTNEAAAGGTCGATEECTHPLYCDNSGHCVARKTLGTTCQGNLANECSGNSRECDVGLCCQAGQCRPTTCQDPTP